jgi:hypothetical protein
MRVSNSDFLITYGDKLSSPMTGHRDDSQSAPASSFSFQNPADMTMVVDRRCAREDRARFVDLAYPRRSPVISSGILVGASNGEAIPDRNYPSVMKVQPPIPESHRGQRL